MSQPEGVVVPPASIRRPLILALVFGALFIGSVSALVSNWSFSPELRNDLLVTGLGTAVLLTGVAFYMALGAIILDIGQPQLWVDEKGIKSPAFPRFAWAEVEGAVLRKHTGPLRRRNCELEIQLSDQSPGIARMSLWQRLRQGKALSQGSVLIHGQDWPMERLQGAIENHLAWYRHRSGELERRLVRYLGDGALPDGEARQQVA